MFLTRTSSADIATFFARTDNIGVLVHEPATGVTVAIDAPEAAPIKAVLLETGWTLTHILLTHHHPDHVDGVEELRAQGVAVIGGAMDAHRLPALDRAVSAGEILAIGGLSFAVLDVPGHTVGHIAYVLEGTPGAAFVGDTLFTLGCGRLFEGTADQMWDSLSALARLPDDTLVWCGHDYTDSNARFAEHFAGKSRAVASGVAEVRRLAAGKMPTVPTTIGFERAHNPFLLGHDTDFASGIGLAGMTAPEVFAATRRAKDTFQ